MSVLNHFKRINRKHWFICHACLMQTNHDPVAFTLLSKYAG